MSLPYVNCPADIAPADRTDFVFKGYRKGVMAFIDQYWHMIHRAAGWGALRAFLLVRRGKLRFRC